MLIFAVQSTREMSTKLKHTNNPRPTVRLIPFILLLITATACQAQEGDFPLSAQDRKQALQLVYDECPKADIIEVESNLDYIEVEYLCEGLLYEVGIFKGKIVVKEGEINRRDIPYDKISTKIAKNYPGFLIDEFSQITAADTSFIRVEIIKEGIERNIYFTKDGHWYTSTGKFTDKDWSGEALKRFRTADLDFPLLKPYRVLDMPDVLREISGIAALGHDEVLCVQDELGVVFRYDLEAGKITKTYRFTDVGDFEDLAINGPLVYVLRSDGSIFSFDFENYDGRHSQTMVPTESLDLEGLDYDPETGRLIMASKEPLQNGDNNLRPVYAFHPDKPAEIETLFTVDENEVGDALRRDFPEIAKSGVRFSPSAVALRPGTDDIYVLSAKDRLLAIYSQEKLKAVYPLPRNAFYKPEGLAFTTAGDLLISSEGDKKGLSKAKVVRFRPR